MARKLVMQRASHSIEETLSAPGRAKAGLMKGTEELAKKRAQDSNIKSHCAPECEVDRLDEDRAFNRLVAMRQLDNERYGLQTARMSVVLSEVRQVLTSKAVFTLSLCLLPPGVLAVLAAVLSFIEKLR